MDREAFESHWRRLIARLRLVRAVRTMQAASFFALSILVILFFADRIAFELGLRASYLSTPSVLGTTAVVFAVALPPVFLLLLFFLPGPRTADIADFERRAGSHESIQTARELMDQHVGGEMTAAVVRQAVRS
ncbi:MAG: hypothetical protein NZM29_08045, partial [Nitrospira sp.]|nr:hypothetical protein [Nitrospira sp.]